MAQMTTDTHSGAGLRKARTHRVSDSLPAETLIGWLKDMLLIREFENRCAQAYQQAKIGGFCHLYTGQEAVAVGTIQSLERDDPIVTAYRDHGHALAGVWTQRVHGRDVRQDHRMRQGQGRVDAHVRQAQLALRRARHRRRPDPAGHGPRFRRSLRVGSHG
ncbi:MAG: hypothetical protein KF705_05545 [Phycisphaeraceae bacterium]|nr:hypothetical protein [Phycisphaeraceae bacterium]